MKIAIIRRKFTAFGGAENFILRASSGLSQLGINFFIISELWKQNANNSKNIHWIEAKSHGLFRFSKLLSFQKSVMKIISLNNFDLIQSHERLTGVDIYRLGDGIHAAWIDRMKKISPWYKKAWLSIDPYHQKIIRIEKEMSEDKSLFYVANSDLVKYELYKYYKVPESRIKVIENGIDTRSFHPASASKKEASKKQLSLNPKLPVVLFVGSGFERKGAFEIVADQTGKQFDPKVLTIVWARRFAGYKRADFLSWDLERFEKLLSNLKYPVQIIFAGKPYPVDHPAISQFNHLVNLSKNYKNVAVLVGYELALSKRMKQASDVWLNNPRVPREASGTSGMTAAMNGSVNFSTDDGWIPEFINHGNNGFVVPKADYANMSTEAQDEYDLNELYKILEQQIVPMYYEQKDTWRQITQNGMKDVRFQFDSNRMADEYYEKMYKI